MRCDKCGVQNVKGSCYCRACGAALNEQPKIGTVYTLSGKYDSTKLKIGIITAIPVVAILSVIYAYIAHYVPIIYFVGIATVCFGIATAYVSHYVFKFTKTRHSGWGVGISVIMSFLALYFSWCFTIDIYFDDFTLSPSIIWDGIEEVVENMSFNVGPLRSVRNGKSGIPISGIFLALVYLIEAAVIVGGGILAAIGLNSSIGFCEKCQQWTKDKFASINLSVISDVSAIQNELQQGKVDKLLELKSVGDNDNHTSFVIQGCACGALNLLTINNVTVTMKENKPEESTTELISNIVISSKAATELSKVFQK